MFKRKPKQDRTISSPDSDALFEKAMAAAKAEEATQIAAMQEEFATDSNAKRREVATLIAEFQDENGDNPLISDAMRQSFDELGQSFDNMVVRQASEIGVTLEQPLPPIEEGHIPPPPEIV